MNNLRAIKTENAPPPAGCYSQAVVAQGEFLFISGQTPRKVDGTRLTVEPFEEHAHRTLQNLAALASAAGYELKTDTAKVNVYLKDLSDKKVFDGVFQQYFKAPPPARCIVQSNFIAGESTERH